MNRQTERATMVSNWHMRALLALTIVAAAGCASSPLGAGDLARLARADARMVEGCYTCLVEARDTYDALAIGPARPQLLVRLFETNILLALRESELAMPAGDALNRAAALAQELPSAGGVTLALELARMGTPDAVGTPRADIRARRRTFADLARTHDGVFPDVPVTDGLSAVFVEYLRATWDCAGDGARGGEAVGAGQTPAGAARSSPLVRYRRATCPASDAAALDALVTEVPDFIEAAYLRARMPSLAVTAEYVSTQRTAFDAARQAFPTSAAVAYSLGSLNQTLGDCRTALTHYDATLRLQPHHEDATLQRIICLGFLGRHETAITAATTIIDASWDNADEAYYWRAWNRNQLRQLDAARDDIEAALRQRVNARNYGLSGTIKYHQHDLEAAERDLTAALQMDPSMCLARWYQGLVAFEHEDWPRTGAAFEGSADCYRDAAAEATEQLAAIEAADLDPVFKKNQIIGFQAVIQEDRSQEQASCLNGANGFLRADERDRAAALLARIPDDSDYASGARQLRDYLVELEEADAR